MSTSPEVIATDSNAAAIAEVLPKLSALQSALEEQNPNIQSYMKSIGENLRQFPELVHLLSDEQIRPIYTAMQRETGVVISAKLAKKATKKTTAAEAAQLFNLL